MNEKSFHIKSTLFIFACIALLMSVAGKSGAQSPQLITSATERPAQIEPVRAPFNMPQLKKPVFPDKTFNIIAFGAKGDGTTKNTDAFKKAIEACSAAGGGMVIVPAGKWLTGAIHLKSNVNLHLEQGAEIHFSDDPDDYLPVVFTRWAGTELYNYSPLIYASNCENIAITGSGKLYGHGENWWSWTRKGEKTILWMYKNQVLKNIPPEKRIAGTPETALRPQFISPVNCKNVLFEGFTVSSPGPFWTFDIIYCENVIVRGLHLETRGGPNTDGINLNSTRNALVEHCLINAGDDGVCIKSGLNEDGRRVGRPSENIVIRNITAMKCHGGVVIGSETSGSIRNVYAHDCLFDGSGIGIRIKSNASRGGTVENIYYANIKMKDIRGEAIRIETDYGAFMASENGTNYPVFRNLSFSHITCENANVAVSMEGTVHQPIENVKLKDLDITARRDMTSNWVNGLAMDNVQIKLTDQPLTLPGVLFTATHEPGLEAAYFNNETLAGPPVFTRTDKQISFNFWAGSAPAPGVNDDHFSVRWTGSLKVPETGYFNIGMEADDGFRLYLDDKLIIDTWENNPLCEWENKPVNLEKDKYYNLKIEYHENLGFGCAWFRILPGHAETGYPEIYNKTDVEKILSIRTAKDVDETRNGLIRFVFGEDGLPYNEMPGEIVENIKDPDYDDIESLQSITRLVVKMDFGLDSKVYHFFPENPNHRVAFYHQGHNGNFILGKAVIRELLNNGYSVIAFSMPLKGMNSTPVVNLPKLGLLRMMDHNKMKFLQPAVGNPVKYFVEPVVAIINYLEKHFKYKDITMIGISGGGWTTTLAAALDTRIKNSFPVAGSYPVYLRSESQRDWGDWEQTIPAMLRKANYLDMYVLGAYGKGRKQVQVINRYDACCFAGLKWETYKSIVEERVKSLGKGSWDLMMDESHHEHKISDFILPGILKEMEK